MVQVRNRAVITSGFVADTEAIRNQLEFAQAMGRSALLDGMYLSLEQSRAARNARKVLLVISDGEDNSSRHTLGEMESLLREDGVVIYTVGIGGVPGGEILNQVTRSTGGRQFTVEPDTDLVQAALAISRALRGI